MRCITWIYKAMDSGFEYDRKVHQKKKEANFSPERN